MDKAESNRQNAAHSTGPRTPEGKAAVSQNAVKHGGFSEALIVMNEDPAEFAALSAGMQESLDPKSPLEEMLVDRLASLWWRLARARRAESEGLQTAMHSELRRYKCEQFSAPAHMTFFSWINSWDGRYQERLQKHETQLERGFFRTLHELERIQTRRQGQVVLPPVVVDVNVTMD